MALEAEILPLRGAGTAAVGVLTVKLIDDSEPGNSKCTR